MGLVTLTFDLVTFKLVRKSHLRWGTFLPNFGDARPLGSQIIRYVRDGRSDEQTDKSNAYCPYGRGNNKSTE